VRANCVIVADDENLDIADEYGFPTVEMGNEFLGARFNAGIHWACTEGGADYVVHIGSDDWVHPVVFDRLPSPTPIPPEVSADNPVAFWNGEPEALTGRQIAIVNLPAGKMQRCHVRGRHGVIPWVLPRQVLEPSGFNPIRPDLQRGIDGSLIAGLRVRPNWVFHDPHPLARVDFKSDTNITPYPGMASNLGIGPEVDPWGPLADIYPLALVEMARATHERLAATSTKEN